MHIACAPSAEARVTVSHVSITKALGVPRSEDVNQGSHSIGPHVGFVFGGSG